MDLTEMWKRFQQFAAVDLFSAQDFAHEAVSYILLDSEWVRIVLTRNPVLTNAVEVDIEVAIPKHRGLHTQDQMSCVLDDLILHLEYLRRLALSGYKIDLIDDEGLWIASGTLNLKTEEVLVANLAPPYLDRL